MVRGGFPLDYLVEEVESRKFLDKFGAETLICMALSSIAIFEVRQIGRLRVF